MLPQAKITLFFCKFLKGVRDIFKKNRTDTINFLIFSLELNCLLLYMAFSAEVDSLVVSPGP
jgi:hypothetical protein